MNYWILAAEWVRWLCPSWSGIRTSDKYKYVVRCVKVICCDYLLYAAIISPFSMFHCSEFFFWSKNENNNNKKKNKQQRIFFGFGSSLPLPFLVMPCVCASQPSSQYITYFYYYSFAISISSATLWTHDAHSYVMMMKFLFPFCRSHSFFVWKTHHSFAISVPLAISTAVRFHSIERVGESESAWLARSQS